ncbi:MAG: hypothetical protein Q9197_005013 [Variospora fuerteventurae]
MSSQRVDSPSNHGPIVSILTWFLLAATVLAVVARVTTKMAISKRLTNDDFLIFLALAFSIGQAVAVSLQTSNGLGQHEAALSAFQMDNFYKFDYASNLLFILNLCFAKLSVLQLLRFVTPVKLHLRLVLGAGAFVTLWSIASELASALQCKTPNTWKVIGNQCFDRAAFWNAYGAFNLITEAALLILPLVILWKLQTQAKKKAVIYSCFASRIVNLSSKSNGKKEKSALSSNNLSHHKHFRHLPDVSTVISANHDVRETDSDSQKSSARIIKYTRTWEVT